MQIQSQMMMSRGHSINAVEILYNTIHYIFPSRTKRMYNVRGLMMSGRQVNMKYVESTSWQSVKIEPLLKS